MGLIAISERDLQRIEFLSKVIADRMKLVPAARAQQSHPDLDVTKGNCYDNCIARNQWLIQSHPHATLHYISPTQFERRTV